MKEQEAKELIKKAQDFVGQDITVHFPDGSSEIYKFDQIGGLFGIGLSGEEKSYHVSAKLTKSGKQDIIISLKIIVRAFEAAKKP